ncbi:MAG: hypothetical protein J7647_16120 [Cyanobacteria bacterium SBLK]|nr:hypothetical protein [Cyanobacteria bacterium SBLK]
MTLIDQDTPEMPETPKAIAIDPLLLKETAKTVQKLAHLFDRLSPHYSPEEIVQKTIQEFQKQRDELIEEVCEDLGSAGVFEHIDRLQDLHKAKSAFITHCFCIMFRQGIAWSEIVQEISNRLPQNENNREEIDKLQELGNSLTLTLQDFS